MTPADPSPGLAANGDMQRQRPCGRGRPRDRSEVEPEGKLGGSFTIALPDRAGSGRRGRSFDLVEVRGQTLIAEPVAGGGSLPAAGTTIRCRSSAGIWEAQVQRTEGERLHLALPAWTARATPRASVRVPMDLMPIECRVGSHSWAGRLLDLSVGGAGVVIERLAGQRTGARPALVLPGGQVQGVVVARRDHDHPLLVVMGIAFDQRDDAARRWIAGQVSARRFG